MDAGMVRENVERVRERIQRAAERAGRRPEEILLLAATKERPPEMIRAAIEAGITDIGENYVQEAQRKKPWVGLPARWHLIGHLQTNKASHALQLFDWIQTLDRPRLAEVLSRRAQALGRRVPLLVEVNLGREPTKTGALPEEVLPLIEQAASLPGLEIRGLMCIPPFTEDPEGARPYFRQLRELAERIAAQGWPQVRMEHLSMGMSHDFEVAIEEGATIVRLGTVLFGPRG